MVKKNNEKPEMAEEKHNNRDIWDKVEIVGKVAASFTTAIIIAGMGYFGHSFVQGLENKRTYTELLTQREQADTNLRKDMFSVLLAQFLNLSTNADSKNMNVNISTMEDLETRISDISSQLLKLELLSMNFSESLILSPLFINLKQQISSVRKGHEKLVDGVRSGHIVGEQTDNISLAGNKINTIDRRLVSLAKKVAVNQIAAIKPGGAYFEIDIPQNEANAEHGYLWPEVDDDESTSDNEDEVDGNWFSSTWSNIFGEEKEIYQNGLIYKCGRVERNFVIEFTSPDEDNFIVNVDISIDKIRSEGEETDPLKDSLQRRFDLDYFNFPLVDNTKLSDDERFAMVLLDFDTKNNTDFGVDRYIRVAVLCFKGAYASVRDKPALNEVIEELGR